MIAASCIDGGLFFRLADGTSLSCNCIRDEMARRIALEITDAGASVENWRQWYQDQKNAADHYCGEVAQMADELAFYKYQAAWWRAYAHRPGNIKEPTERGIKLAGEAIEDARRAENAERYAHAEPPRDPGGT